jgi:hypothetical protein
VIYTKKNVLVSVSVQLAEIIKALGYNVLWSETGDIDEADDPSLGTVTLAPSFPANPQYIQRLNDVTQNDEIIVIPAFSLQLASPKKIQRTGLGETTFVRERLFRIDGFARDTNEQELLGNAIYEWLDADDTVISVFNYDEEESDPDALESAWVEYCGLEIKTLEIEGADAVRNYIKIEAALRYIE